MKRFRVAVAVVFIIFLSSLVLIPFANADWPMFHADPSRSGAGTGNPALTPTLLWSYTTGNEVVSSPAVVGGVVYVGSMDGNVYALGGSPTPSPTTVPPTTDGYGVPVNFTISGNVTSAQMSNVTIATNQSATTTTISFTVTGESGTTGFGNVTIPKSAVPYGTTPTIYIDNQPAQDQGYTQDSINYYVWYTIHFSTHEVSIVFTTASSSSLPQEAIYGIAAAVAIVAIVAVVLVLRKSKKGKS